MTHGAAFLTQACQVTKTQPKGLGIWARGGDSGIRSRPRSEGEKQLRGLDAESQPPAEL